MDIVSRLKQFMANSGISNSQFADTCDIPRPTLSQLLNGRNKKVSDEVIGKIHRAYPTLNVLWLMFGDGEMLLNGHDSIDGNDNMAGAENGAGAMHDDQGQRSISFDDDEGSAFAPTSKPAQRTIQGSQASESLQTYMRNGGAGRMANRGAASPDARRVIKIAVFYSDGRFDEFSPVNNK